MQLAVLSEDLLKPPFGWLSLGPPLERALVNRTNAILVSPPPLIWSERRRWGRAVHDVRRADTLFWMQWSARPKLPIWLMAAANPRARRVAYICDPWRPSLTKIGLFATLHRLDPCFVTYREAYEELKRRFPKARFEWLPTGVDSDLFKPGHERRDIFAYWMGRRFEPLHQALIRYCSARGLSYVYTDFNKELRFGESAQLARRARYFVVSPPDLNDMSRTGGFSPLVMRYLEGLAAGAKLLGVLPRSGEYERIGLSRDAILEVCLDGSDLAQKLDSDARQLADDAAVARARDFVKKHHSWATRAEQIYARLSEERTKSVDLRNDFFNVGDFADL